MQAKGTVDDGREDLKNWFAAADAFCLKYSDCLWDLVKLRVHY